MALVTPFLLIRIFDNESVGKDDEDYAVIHFAVDEKIYQSFAPKSRHRFSSVRIEALQETIKDEEAVSDDILVKHFIELGAEQGMRALYAAEQSQLPAWLARLSVLKGWSERYPLAALSAMDGLSAEDRHVVIAHAWPAWFHVEPQGALYWLDSQTNPDVILTTYDTLALSLSPKEGKVVIDTLLGRNDPELAFSRWAESWAGRAPELAIPLVESMAEDLEQSELVDYFLSAWSEYDETATYAWMDANHWSESD